MNCKTIKEKAKINRIWWDFSNEKTKDIIFRTKPLYADWFTLIKIKKEQTKVYIAFL